MSFTCSSAASSATMLSKWALCLVSSSTCCRRALACL